MNRFGEPYASCRRPEWSIDARSPCRAHFLLLVFVLGSAIFLWPSCLARAQQEYTPSYHPPVGDEIILVLISSSTCIANHSDEFDSNVRSAKALVSRHAQELDRDFSTVGVSTDWEADQGVGYLLRGEWEGTSLDFGAWDEISVGRNWGNTLAVRYMQKLSDGCPEKPIELGIPQMFLLERTARDWREDGRFRHGDEKLLLQLCGADEIAAWVEEGAPIPEPVDAG